MDIVTPKTLNDQVEYGLPFNLSPHSESNEYATSWRAVSAAYRDWTDYPASHDLGHAPGVYVESSEDEHGTVHVVGLPYMDSGGWDFFSTGYTCIGGRLRKDPSMDYSESLGGHLAADMITEGGTYVITEVTILSGQEAEQEYSADGWVVLRKQD